MRYLFVTGHPAHVHLFKNVIRVLGQAGNEILVGAVSREVTTDLLEAYRIPYARFGRSQPELISKALGVLPKEISLLKVARQFDPDLFVSTGSPYAAHVSALLAKPHIVFGDTESASLIARIMVPYSDAVFTPDCYQGNLGPKHRRYNGYKELAYLHPKYFRPDQSALDRVGLSRTEPYVILRFASWDASHDLTDHGFRFRDARAAISFVEELRSLGRVVITSDQDVDPPFDDFALSCPPEVMHDILAFAKLYIGEGATMAAEAGVLGVPWIFISARGRGFLSDQQDRYGLGYWVRDIASARKILAQLSVNDVQRRWHAKREQMLAEKEDVVSFICRAIEAWSSSRWPLERNAG
jgi:predicted glycosyltransferase